MSFFDNSGEAPEIRRTMSAPAEPQTTSGEPRPSVLTCIECHPELEKLRAGVYEEFAPTNALRRHLADQIAEEAWHRGRVSVIADQSLSVEIESSFKQVLQRYPNADSAMHTIEAWRKVQSDPAIRLALSEQHKVTNRMLAVMRSLSAASRRR